MSETSTFSSHNTTKRPLLGRRLTLLQPQKGYRSAIEPILLAASCAAKKTQHILDIGCGVGTAALCLAKRIEGLHITGVDIQPALIELAQQNAVLNGLNSCTKFIQGDLATITPKTLPRGHFHQVITNPPFYTTQEADQSPYESKAIGHVESTVGLEEWIRLSAKYVRSQGSLIVIYTAARLAELIEAMSSSGLGAIEILPLWPRQGVAAKRVLVRGIKCRQLRTTLHAGLVLHENESYTPKTREILDDLVPLVWA